MRTFIAVMFGVILVIPAFLIAFLIHVYALALKIEKRFDTWMQESFK